MLWDAIVVGSGFGGSITAARLAQKGLKVLILERGPWWGPAGEGQEDSLRRPFPQGAGATRLVRNVRMARSQKSREWLLNKDGWLETHLFDHLLTVTGSGVGGGSLIYTNILHQPDDDFFQGFPPEITAREMRPYFQRVRDMLRPAPMPHLPEKNRVFEAMASHAGLGGVTYPELAVVWGDSPNRQRPVVNAAGVAQGSCNFCGTCILGCPTKAKTTMDLTYVPLALRHGATLRPLCEVTAIAPHGKGYAVRFTDHRTGQTKQAAGRRLILAAGTLNTLRLLFAARDRHRTLPRLPRTLGQRFSPNGDMGAAFLFSPQLKNSAHGPAFNAFLRHPQRGHYEYLIGEVGLPLAALPLPGPLKNALAGCAMILAMGRDSATGVLTYDGKNLHTPMGRDVGPELFDAIEKSVEKLSAHYQPRWLMNNAPGGRGASTIATVHPMGGASLGRSAEEAVTHHTGQIFGHPGLYVADGSLYPRPPGIPTSLTIAALAERQASLMVS